LLSAICNELFLNLSWRRKQIIGFAWTITPLFASLRAIL
jgi:hypothetical protein